MKKELKLIVSLFAVIFLCSPFVVLAKNTKDKINEKIDKGADELKKKAAEFQEWLDHCHWKGMIQEVVLGPVTLHNLKVNGQERGLTLQVPRHDAPNHQVELEVEVKRDPNCPPGSYHRIVAGLKGKGAQTSFGNWWGVPSERQLETVEKFSLVIPREPGNYEVRFRYVEKAWFEKDALEAWIDKETGQEPHDSTTMAIIIVK